MSNADSVGQLTGSSFGQFKIATSGPVAINSTAANVVVMPILNGGITNNGGGYIVRRITVTNQSTVNTALANVQICTSSDGNTSNSVTSNVLLSTLTPNGTWQELTLTTAANTTILTAQALWANVITNVANSTVTFNVFGDVVSF